MGVSPKATGREIVRLVARPIVQLSRRTSSVTNLLSNGPVAATLCAPYQLSRQDDRDWSKASRLSAGDFGAMRDDTSLTRSSSTEEDPASARIVELTDKLFAMGIRRKKLAGIQSVQPGLTSPQIGQR